MVRIAIIGLGNIAHKHAEVIHALPDATIVAGVKRNAESGRAFCSQYGIPGYFSSTDDLLAWGEFDAAVICCGHHFTVELTKQVLLTGRPCLIEKPVGFSAGETLAVANAAGQGKTWGMVAVNRRFFSIVQQARNLIEQAGGLRAIRVEHTEWMHQAAEWGLSDDLLDRYLYINGIHLVDTMCHLAGLPVSTDVITRNFPGRRNAYDAMVRFPSGAIGHYSGQWYAPGRWALDLFAEDLRITFPRMEEAVIQRTGHNPEPLLLDEVDQRFKPGFYRQMEAFVERLEAKTGNRKADAQNSLSKIQNPVPPSRRFSVSASQRFSVSASQHLSPIPCLLPEAVEIMAVIERLACGTTENRHR